MQDSVKIKRALISVSDKTGLVELGKKLCDLGVEIISTGGTLAQLRNSEIQAISIATFTGAPEILGGRVKTLHPKVHAGILFKREDKEHLAEMSQQEYKPIDLVVVNLYPFEQTLANPEATHKDKIENIDIGGPTMIRAAAKNLDAVAVVTDPGDYSSIIDEMDENGYHMMDWWWDVFGPNAWIFMMLGWVIFLGIAILLAYYVHKDAVKRGIANAEIWLIIILVFNVVGVILYLLVRKNYEVTQ